MSNGDNDCGQSGAILALAMHDSAPTRLPGPLTMTVKREAEIRKLIGSKWWATFKAAWYAEAVNDLIRELDAERAVREEQKRLFGEIIDGRVVADVVAECLRAESVKTAKVYTDDLIQDALRDIGKYIRKMWGKK